jgi:hypothetical protein
MFLLPRDLPRKGDNIAVRRVMTIKDTFCIRDKIRPSKIKCYDKTRKVTGEFGLLFLCTLGSPKFASIAERLSIKRSCSDASF